MKFLEAIEKSEDYYINFVTRSVNESSRIEGNVLSYVETYALIFNDNSFTINEAKPRDIHEVINLKEALLKSFRVSEFNTPLIIALNEIVNRNIKDLSRNSKIDVSMRIQDLLDSYRSDSRPLIERIADFQIQFEHIHPFEYGNGKTGRLLINSELIRNAETPIVIPYGSRTQYFSFLANYDTKGLAEMFKQLQIQEDKIIDQYCRHLQAQE